MSEKPSEKDQGAGCDGSFEVFCGGSPSCGQLFPPLPGQPFVGVDGECSACLSPASGSPVLLSSLAATARRELGIAPSEPPFPDPELLLGVARKDPQALAALSTAARSFSEGELLNLQSDEAELVAQLTQTGLDEDHPVEVKNALLNAVRAELQRRQHESGVRPA